MGKYSVLARPNGGPKLPPSELNISPTLSSQSHVYDNILTITLSSDPPEIINSSLPYQAVSLGNNLTLTCELDGVPTPDIQWVQNGVVVSSGSAVTIIISNELSSFTLENFQRNHAGTYECNASNIVGSIGKQFIVQIEGNLKLARLHAAVLYA